MTTWQTTEQTVTWTSTAGTTWRVVRGSTGGGGGGGASAINDLTDVDTATDPPATDDVLAWDGTLWTPAGLTAADTGAIPASIIDAKGDVIVGTANDTAARLAVGADGQVLTADSAETSGVKWAAAGGGGGVTEVRMTTTSFHSLDGPANNPRPVGITTSQTRGRSILSPFTATGTTQVFGGVPWLPWSTVDIWIDFLNTNASAGDVKWQVAFGGQAGAHTQLTLYAATVAVTAASGNETTYGQRYTQKIASAVAVATTDMLDCQVVRLGDDAADTLAGSVWLKQLRFREAGT